MVTKNRCWNIDFKKSLLFRGMSLVVNFVLLGRTHSLLVILGINTVFRFSSNITSQNSKCFLHNIIYIAKQVFL